MAGWPGSKRRFLAPSPTTRSAPLRGITPSSRWQDTLQGTILSLWTIARAIQLLYNTLFNTNGVQYLIFIAINYISINMNNILYGLVSPSPLPQAPFLWRILHAFLNKMYVLIKNVNIAWIVVNACQHLSMLCCEYLPYLVLYLPTVLLTQLPYGLRIANSIASSRMHDTLQGTCTTTNVCTNRSAEPAKRHLQQTSTCWHSRYSVDPQNAALYYKGLKQCNPPRHFSNP